MTLPLVTEVAMDKDRGTGTAEERAAFEHLVAVGKDAARKVTQARLLWWADTTAGGGYAEDASVAALAGGLGTVGRVRERLVTEGLPAALHHPPPPPRPDQSQSQGNLAPRRIPRAGSAPPEGRGPGTLPRRAEERVVGGWVEDLRLETARQALTNTTAHRGSSRPGASRPRPTPRPSGAGTT